MLLLHFYYISFPFINTFACFVCAQNPRCSKFAKRNLFAFLFDFVILENAQVSRGTETGFPRVFAVAVRTARIDVGWMRPRECAIIASARRLYAHALSICMTFLMSGASVFHFENRNARNGVVWVMREVDFPSRNLAIIATSLHAPTTGIVSPRSHKFYS